MKTTLNLQQRQTYVTLVKDGRLTPEARSRGYKNIEDVMQNSKQINRSGLSIFLL